MNIYDPVFSTAQVAIAAGMKPTNFRAHLARGNWSIGDKSTAAEGAGKGHSFSIYDAVGYALAHKLIVRGIDPKVAFDRAMFDFAHVGTTIYQGTEPIMRDPGDVFDIRYGRTFFVYAPGSDRAECLAQKLINDPIMLFFTSDRSFAEEIIAIDLNQLRDRVFNSLGLDAHDYE